MDGTRKENTKRPYGCMTLTAVTIFLFIVLDCSGLNFPVIGPQSSFGRAMNTDFGVEVPPSLKVLHAARCATRDPAYYYECDLAAADFASFRAQIESGARFRGHEVRLDRTDNRVSLGPRPPNWYNPRRHPDIALVDIGISKGPGDYQGYWFFFSAADHKIYVYWFAT